MFQEIYKYLKFAKNNTLNLTVYEPNKPIDSEINNIQFILNNLIAKRKKQIFDIRANYFKISSRFGLNNHLKYVPNN